VTYTRLIREAENLRLLRFQGVACSSFW